jgi:hypothetical protein
LTCRRGIHCWDRTSPVAELGLREQEPCFELGFDSSATVSPLRMLFPGATAKRKKRPLIDQENISLLLYPAKPSANFLGRGTGTPTAAIRHQVRKQRATLRHGLDVVDQQAPAS